MSAKFQKILVQKIKFIVSRGYRKFQIFLDGYLKFGKYKIPKTLIAGVVSIIFLYVGVAGAVSINAPILINGDTRYHVDYAWQLYHGDIPKRTEGIKYTPFIEIFGHKPQSASANPPLFYALHAPLVGPLMDKGDWHLAIALGRVLNIILGILCIFALAWAGWVFANKRKSELALAIPAISVMTYRFTRLNLDYALDAQLVLLTTLSLVICYKLLKYGPSLKRLVIITILSVLGMATKAPYIVFLAINLFTIFTSIIINSPKNTKRNIIRGLLISGGILLVVLVSVGWFYYIWNYKVHGKWFTARPPEYRGGRPWKSFSQIIKSQNLWGLFYADYTRVQSISVAITTFAIAGWLTIKKINLNLLMTNRALGLTVLVMAFGILGTFATQLEHAVGIGSINFRYMLPTIFPISWFLAYGILQFRKTHNQLLSTVIFAMGGSTLYTLAIQEGRISKVILFVFTPLFVFGFIMFATTLYYLSTQQTNEN
jgi:4-amino-4-deoxy-L-arabinose transferase-like glycosyltransferase